MIYQSIDTVFNDFLITIASNNYAKFNRTYFIQFLFEALILSYQTNNCNAMYA